MVTDQASPNTYESMSGKVCLITGASSGIGRATAGSLAELGATVLMHGQDHKRSLEALEEVTARARGDGSAQLFTADLSSMDQTRQLAEKVLDKNGRLDVLVNNAGVLPSARRITIDGYEYTFALNHLSPFLLTMLLLDRLKASAASRIVTVSSVAHLRGKLHLDDLHGERKFGTMAAYRQSKLANVFFCYELARQLKGTGVTSNCLHPGVVASRLLKPGDGLVSRMAWLAGLVTRPLLRSPERGAQTVIYLASSPEVERVTGRYFEDCKQKPSSRFSYDLETANHLWEISLRMTGLSG